MSLIQPVISQISSQQIQKSAAHEATLNNTSQVNFAEILKTVGLNLLMPVQENSKKNDLEMKRNKEEQESLEKMDTVFDLIGRVEALERALDQNR